MHTYTRHTDHLPGTQPDLLAVCAHTQTHTQTHTHTHTHIHLLIGSCITIATGVVLSEAGWDDILSAYPPRPDRLVEYRRLQPLLAQPPAAAHEPVPSDMAGPLDAALAAIRSHCALHGITIRAAFRDFDPHQRGLVTHTQVSQAYGPMVFGYCCALHTIETVTVLFRRNSFS